MTAACTDEQFVALWHENGGSPTRLARHLGISERAVYLRRRNMERAMQTALVGNVDCNNPGGGRRAWASRVPLTLRDGVIVCPSDLHSMPLRMRDRDTLAMAALLRLIPLLRPDVVLFMGDALDGASISRHPPQGWETKPTVEDEIGAVQHDLGRIADAAAGAELAWVVGNHDQRYDYTLAQRVPEFRNITGFSLGDAFPAWQFAWSFLINDTALAVHRWHGGVHARWNNVLKAGCSVISGDTHRLGATPYATQSGGTNWAVECGTTADVNAPCFEYLRGLAPQWQQGFAVLTFRDGELLPPELCTVHGGGAYFRGELIAGRGRVRAKTGEYIS